MYLCIYVCVCMYTNVCMYVCVCVCMCVCIYVCMYAYICTCVCVFVYMYAISSSSSLQAFCDSDILDIKIVCEREGHRDLIGWSPPGSS